MAATCVPSVSDLLCGGSGCSLRAVGVCWLASNSCLAAICEPSVLLVVDESVASAGDEGDEFGVVGVDVVVDDGIVESASGAFSERCQAGMAGA